MRKGDFFSSLIEADIREQGVSAGRLGDNSGASVEFEN
jgi:hypothetical protein